MRIDFEFLRYLQRLQLDYYSTFQGLWNLTEKVADNSDQLDMYIKFSLHQITIGEDVNLIDFGIAGIEFEIG